MHFFDKKRGKNRKRGLSLALVLGLLLAVPTGYKYTPLELLKGELVWATPQSERDEAQDELDDINNNLSNLEDQMSELEGQLSEKAAILSDLLADKEILENDIVQTQIAIEQAEVDLAAAKEQEAAAYEAMKLRIQYMYENSTQDSIWEAILNANGVADLLNRVEYISQVHETDRQLLEDYKAVVAEVETLAAELDAKMNDLVALQEIYEHQEAALESAMAALEAEADDFEAQIATAKQRATQLANYIEEQNRLIEIQRQEEERKRKEEEERKKQEEEEKKRQEELLAQQQQQNNNNSNNDNSSNNSDNNNSDSSNNSNSSDKATTTGGYLNDSSYDPDFTSDVTGEELVNYALQFVGNPYKWGGNSLTDGCDCSGFVNLIYRHFGFTNVPRQSQAFKSYGKPVAFENIKAGDIVVYPGHVAIYIGNGKIVEAQSSRAGITCNRSVTSGTITAIRRVL